MCCCCAVNMGSALGRALARSIGLSGSFWLSSLQISRRHSHSYRCLTLLAPNRSFIFKIWQSFWIYCYGLAVFWLLLIRLRGRCPRDCIFTSLVTCWGSTFWRGTRGKWNSQLSGRQCRSCCLLSGYIRNFYAIADSLNGSQAIVLTLWG